MDQVIARRHFLDQPLEFPFGKPDLLFDQPGREGSGEVDQEDVKEGSDHLDGDYHHLFYEGSLEAPEYFEDYFDEGFALDYEYPQANYEDQSVQDEEQVIIEKTEVLGELLGNKTAPEGRWGYYWRGYHQNLNLSKSFTPICFPNFSMLPKNNA